MFVYIYNNLQVQFCKFLQSYKQESAKNLKIVTVSINMIIIMIMLHVQKSAKEVSVCLCIFTQEIKIVTISSHKCFTCCTYPDKPSYTWQALGEYVRN